MNMIMMIAVSSMITGTLTMLFLSVKEEKEQMMAEANSFECGFSNLNDKKMPFSTNFIMIIMLFIMFDIEVSIMIPMILKSSLSLEWSATPIVFLLALTMILTKEWKIGTLEWSK